MCNNPNLFLNECLKMCERYNNAYLTRREAANVVFFNTIDSVVYCDQARNGACGVSLESSMAEILYHIIAHSC